MYTSNILPLASGGGGCDYSTGSSSPNFGLIIGLIVGFSKSGHSTSTFIQYHS